MYAERTPGDDSVSGAYAQRMREMVSPPHHRASSSELTIGMTVGWKNTSERSAALWDPRVPGPPDRSARVCDRIPQAWQGEGDQPTVELCQRLFERREGLSDEDQGVLWR